MTLREILLREYMIADLEIEYWLCFILGILFLLWALKLGLGL